MGADADARGVLPVFLCDVFRVRGVAFDEREGVEEVPLREGVVGHDGDGGVLEAVIDADCHVAWQAEVGGYGLVLIEAYLAVLEIQASA